jgi:hypothetical protein
MIPARILVLAGAGVLALAGCASSPSVAPTSAAPSGAAASASTATATPSAVPTLSATGTAAENKAYFSLVTKELLASNATPTGRQFIDNLVKAGFDKKNMEVTADKTAIGLTADAIEFSVKFGTECLVGQKGEAFGFTVVELPVLDTGTCLVGKTRTIDW